MRREPAVEKPRRPRSAYMGFFADVKNEVSMRNPDFNVMQVSKAIGQSWKNLTEQEKQPYYEAAAEDKERYDREMEEYQFAINSLEGDGNC
jgi:hypothetical protein